MFTPELRLQMWSLEHIRAQPLPLLAAIAIALALAGCAAPQPLPEAKGDFRPLNTGRWSPQPADVKAAKNPLAPPSASDR